MAIHLIKPRGHDSKVERFKYRIKPLFFVKHDKLLAYKLIHHGYHGVTTDTVDDRDTPANTNYAVGTLTGDWEYPPLDFKTDYDTEQEILNG